MIAIVGARIINKAEKPYKMESLKREEVQERVSKTEKEKRRKARLRERKMLMVESGVYLPPYLRTSVAFLSRSARGP